MFRIAGQPNKLSTEVKEKLQTVMDDVVSKLDVNSMTTDQKIKMLQKTFIGWIMLKPF